MQGARWSLCCGTAILCIVAYFCRPRDEEPTSCEAECGCLTCGGCSACGAEFRFVTMSEIELLLPLPGQIDGGEREVVSVPKAPIDDATPVAQAADARVR